LSVFVSFFSSLGIGGVFVIAVLEVLLVLGGLLDDSVRLFLSLFGGGVDSLGEGGDFLVEVGDVGLDFV
jgi:hypothetical protein